MAIAMRPNNGYRIDKEGRIDWVDLEEEEDLSELEAALEPHHKVLEDEDGTPYTD